MTEKKRGELGFLALISVVIGSQIGSGAFILPSLLAPFGTMGLCGWGVSVSGAISLALIFSRLSSKFPKSGGPHVYVSEAFGREAGFFTAWIYWIISWSSNSLLLVTATKYLGEITGSLSKIQVLMFEIVVLLAITFVNLLGLKFSGLIEIILATLKLVPLFVFPLIFFLFFDSSFFHVADVSTGFSGKVDLISKATLLTSWGFIGVECATTPAERVKNPKKTIPKAIIMGTSFVAFVYVINTISVIGVTGFDSLLHSSAPYSVAIRNIFGDVAFDFVSIIAMMVCVGTLNAWVLTGAQIAHGAYKDGLFPKIFGKTNKGDAPIVALLSASVGTIPFLILEQMDFARGGLDTLVEILVSIFLIIYLVCCISYVKLIKIFKYDGKSKIGAYALAVFAVLFCIFVLAENVVSTVITFFVLVLMGVPIFYKNREMIKTHC